MRLSRWFGVRHITARSRQPTPIRPGRHAVCAVDGAAITDRRHPIDAAGISRARAHIPSPGAAAQAAALLSLIADPTRARLLYTLQQVEELCVGDLCVALQLGEDKISYALRLLRTAGVLARRRAGRVIYYRLADDAPPLLRGPFLTELLAMTEFPGRATRLRARSVSTR